MNIIAYQNCVSQIKNIFDNDQINMNFTTKYNIITQIIRKYYLSENIHSVYEGFLHLLIEFSNYTTTLKTITNNSLAIQALQIYLDFYSQLEPFDQDILTKSIFFDKIIYVSLIYNNNFNALILAKST